MAFLNGLQTFWDSSKNATADDVTCTSDVNHYRFYQLSLIPSVIFTIVLAATTKRKEKLSKFIDGRPGLLFPMNALTRTSRLPYACAFGATALLVYQIVIDQKFALQYDGLSSVKPLIAIVSMMVYGTVFFPVFASLALDTAFSLVLGTLLSWMFAGVNIYQLFECDYNSAGRAAVIVRNIPALICHMYLSLALPVRVVMACRVGRFVTPKDDDMSQDVFTFEKVRNSYQGKHVRKLLRKPVIKGPRPLGFANMLKATLLGFLHSWIYRRESGFRYPSRLLSVMVTAGIVVYVIAVEALVQVVSYLDMIKDIIRGQLDYIGWEDEPNDFEELKEFRSGMVTAFFIADMTRTCVIVSVTLASLCSLITILHMLTSYRNNLYAMYKGDYKNIPSPYDKSAASLCIGSIKFAGFQVAYIIWAYFIILLVLFLIAMVLAIIIVLIVEGEASWLFGLVLSILPSLGITVALMVIQMILAKKVFLLGDGQYLRLNNRRFFFVFTYFMFFYNIFLGFVSCLLRIIKAIGVGIIFLARLDNSTLPRRFEFFDPGFSAYQGYIHMEAAHTHPVVIVFIQLLSVMRLESKRASEKIADPNSVDIEMDSVNGNRKQNGTHVSHAVLNDVSGNGGKAIQTREINFAARFNWWVTYTLLQNPQVRIYRKGFIQAMQKARKEGLHLPISDMPISDFDLVKLQSDKEIARKEEEESLKLMKQNAKHSVGKLLPHTVTNHMKNDKKKSSLFGKKKYNIKIKGDVKGNNSQKNAESNRDLETEINVTNSNSASTAVARNEAAI